MQAFYEGLSQGMSKAKALQAAQIELIQQTIPVTAEETNDENRASGVLSYHDGTRPETAAGFSHPYY